MDVSIVIINFNTFELTCKCLESVYKLTEGITFEIILVDNASIECNADLFKEKFPELILIKNKINDGFARGNNIGIKQTQAPVILLLNSDTVLVNNAIKIARDTLISNSHLGAVSVKLLYPDGSIQKQCERLPSVFLILLEKFRLHKLLSQGRRGALLLGSYFNHQHYVEPETIWGTFFMFKREVLLKMPGQKLNDDYFMYFEDTQWCIDIKDLNYKIGYEPKGNVTHFMGQSNAPKNDMMVKNKEQFMKKNYNHLKISILKYLGY